MRTYSFSTIRNLKIIPGEQSVLIKLPENRELFTCYFIQLHLQSKRSEILGNSNGARGYFKEWHVMQRDHRLVNWSRDYFFSFFFFFSWPWIRITDHVKRHDINSFTDKYRIPHACDDSSRGVTSAKATWTALSSGLVSDPLGRASITGNRCIHYSFFTITFVRIALSIRARENGFRNKLIIV